MKSRHFSFGLCATAAFFGLTSRSFAKADIPSPQERALVVEQGDKLLNPPAHEFDPEKIKLINPFIPNQKAEVKVVTKRLRPDSDADFLALLAAKLNPTGVLMMGDDAVLLFGEKKVKVGESIKIPFDSDSIDVELIDLSRTSFTLKFNQEQLTRPIKPAKTP